ncbi:hypothetical protein F5884DRAFT_10672 [Xylogone sp. PMI_703]|nr:hypothetical protein F5884DRAFT_10672 [Xylogone sp. PMI_703]
MESLGLQGNALVLALLISPFGLQHAHIQHAHFNNITALPVRWANGTCIGEVPRVKLDNYIGAFQEARYPWIWSNSRILLVSYFDRMKPAFQ